MLLSRELLSQQLRQLYVREWCSTYAIIWSRRYRWQSLGRVERFPGGQDPQQKRLPKKETTPASSSIQSANSNCVVPLLHMWMRLQSLSPKSTPSSRLRSVRRLRLEQQPLLQNLRRFISLRWNSLYRRIFTEHPVDEAAMQAERQRRNWLQNLIWSFKSISNKLELALLPARLSLSYTNRSAAMEIIDLSVISQKLNSLLIEYIVNNEEYLKAPSQAELDVIQSETT